MKKVPFLFLLLFLSSLSQAQNIGWQTIDGLPGAQIHFTFVDGSDSIWMKTVAGNRKSKDGVNWYPTNKIIGTGSGSVSNIFRTSNNIFFATDGPSIAYSKDEGLTWVDFDSLIFGACHSYTQLIETPSKKLVLCDFDMNANFSQVSMSDDWGNTWTHTGYLGERIYAAKYDFHGKLFVGVEEGIVTGNSIDSLSTTPLYDRPVNDIIIVKDNAGKEVIYAATNGQGIIESIDSGAHWNPITAILVDSVFTRVYMDRDHRLFAFTETGTCYTSENHVNWKLAGKDLRFSVLSENSKNQLVIDGAIYNAATNSFVKTDRSFREIAFNNAFYMGGKLYAATYDKYYKYSGSSWEPIDLDGMPFLIKGIDAVFLYINGVLNYSNDFIHWKHWEISKPLDKIYFSSFTTAYSSYYSLNVPVYAIHTDTVYRSVDGGKTWKVCFTHVTEKYSFISQIFEYAGTVCVRYTSYASATVKDTLWISTNSGTSWDVYVSPTRQSSISSISGTLIMDAVPFYYSTDRGKNWLQGDFKEPILSVTNGYSNNSFILSPTGIYVFGAASMGERISQEQGKKIFTANDYLYLLRDYDILKSIVPLRFFNTETDNLIIFPNPIREGEDMSFFTSTTISEYQIIIYANDGKKIMEFPASIGFAEHVDVSRLQPGIYILVVNSADGVKTARFIKQ